MYEAFNQVVDVEHATTLMDHLPPGGWHTVATKDDFHALEAKFRDLEHSVKREIDALEHRLGQSLELRFEAKLHKELRDVQRNLFFAFLAAQTTFAGIIGGLVVAVT